MTPLLVPAYFLVQALGFAAAVRLNRRRPVVNEAYLRIGFWASLVFVIETVAVIVGVVLFWPA